MRRDRKRCNKNEGSIALHVLFIIGFITLMDLPEKIRDKEFISLKNNILWYFIQLIYVFAYPTSITPSAELDF